MDGYLFKRPTRPVTKRKLKPDHLPSKRSKTGHAIPSSSSTPAYSPIEKAKHQSSILDYWHRSTKKMPNNNNKTNKSPSSTSLSSSSWFSVDDGFMSKLKEFKSKVANNLNLNLRRLPHSPYKRAEEQRRFSNVSPMVYLENKLKNVVPSKPASNDIKVRKRLFDDDFQATELKAQILKGSDLAFLDKLKDFNIKLNAMITPTSRSTRSPENTCKFFKEKQKQRLRIQQLVESLPERSVRQTNEKISLASRPLTSSTELGLPDKYMNLYRMFNSLERVVTIMFNRLECCTFNRLKQGVQKIMKKEFNMTHLAQILTIYPSAYKVGYDKTSTGRYHLVITPNVQTTKMTPFTTLSRTNQFKDNLVLFAERAHADYLLSLDEPVIINDIEPVRWHPNFIFSDIPETKLPEHPTISRINKQTNSMNSYLLNKLNLSANKSPELQLMCITNSPSKSKSSVKVKYGVLKGLTQELVDKVQIKSLQRTEPITEQEKRLVELKTLPEFVRTIQSLFANENKKSISMDKVIEKCSAEWSISAEKCSKLIKLTNEQLSDWLLILKIGKGKFIKINPHTPLNSLNDRLKRAIYSQC